MAEGEKKKKSSIVMIVALVVVGLLLAEGVSYFIATKIVADKAVAEKSASHDPGTFIKLGDAKDGLILNIGGVNSGRYIKISMVIEIKPDKKAEPSDGKNKSPEEIKIQDTVVALLRAQKVEEFEPTRQEQLKQLVKAEVNKALGSDRVYDVYITNLVLQ